MCTHRYNRVATSKAMNEISSAFVKSQFLGWLTPAQPYVKGSTEAV